MTVELLLIIFGLLVFKHFVMGYLWRTPYEIANSSNPCHIAAYQHAGKHILGSLPIYGMATISYYWLLAALVIEFVSHVFSEFYHEKVQDAAGWDSKIDREYWYALGLKEAFHFFVYLMMVAMLVLYSPQGFQGW